MSVESAGIGISEIEHMECKHHWIIEAAEGPTSRGICCLCGEVREFENYQADFRWEGEDTPFVSGNDVLLDNPDSNWDAA